MLEWVLRRWHLKLLAVGLAFAVWVAVTGEGRGVQDFRVPVEVLLATNTTLSGTPPSNVTVRLRGPESTLRRLDPFDLTIKVDLRNAAAGDRSVQLTPANVAGVPRDVEITQMDPERLRLLVSRKKRREVTVVPTIIGRPARGYQVYRAVARPEALDVEGPESRLSGLSRLKTDPIPVDDRSEPFVARVGVIPEANDVRVADLRPLDVTVYIDLAPVDATIEHVPVIVAGASETATTTPATVNVTVSAPSALVPKLRAGHVRAVVDVNGSEGQATKTGVPVRIEFPGLDAEERAKVTVKAVSRKTVDVRRSSR